MTLASAVHAVPAPVEPAESPCASRDWNAARKRAERAFRKTLLQVLAQKPGKRTLPEIEQLARREARVQARKHVEQARAKAELACAKLRAKK